MSTKEKELARHQQHIRETSMTTETKSKFKDGDKVIMMCHGRARSIETVARVASQRLRLEGITRQWNPITGDAIGPDTQYIVPLTSELEAEALAEMAKQEEKDERQAKLHWLNQEVISARETLLEVARDMRDDNIVLQAAEDYRLAFIKLADFEGMK